MSIRDSHRPPLRATAPHPFREQVRVHQARNALRPRVLATEGDQDWKLFALSFTAFFVCFYTFLV